MDEELDLNEIALNEFLNELPKEIARATALGERNTELVIVLTKDFYNRLRVRHNGKPRLTQHGYARVCIRSDSTGARHDLYIHRLVAEHFIPNPSHKRYVNHKNCRRDDNRVDNLEWATAKENTDYTVKVGHILRDGAGRYASNSEYVI